MEQWLVGGTLALIAITFIVWDIRNSLKRGGSSGDGGSDGDGSSDRAGGDGD